jgi:hypothetical protein
MDVFATPITMTLPPPTPPSVMTMRFLNRRTGSWQDFKAKIGRVLAAFAPINSWIVGKIPIPGVPSHGGQVFATSASFSISALSGSYGVVFAQDGTSGSILTFCFSSQPPPLPIFLYGMIAGTVTVVRSQLFGKLATEFVPFRVD